MIIQPFKIPVGTKKWGRGIFKISAAVDILLFSVSVIHRVLLVRVINPVLNLQPGGPAICNRGFRPLEWLPTTAIEVTLSRFYIRDFLLLDELHPKANYLYLGQMLMCARVFQHAGRPTHGITLTLATSTSHSIKTEILDPS